MINKIFEIIRENRRNQKEILKYSKELNWANVYHDSIKGIAFLESLSLNTGRWAGNYAFFYVLKRILTDFSPSSILELGLGESTKFVSAFLDNNKLADCRHLVIEEDKNWLNFFLEQNGQSKETEICVISTETIIVEGNQTKVYSNFEKLIAQKYDLYIIDGPKGSGRFSRYDLVRIVENVSQGDEFIFLIDDYERLGERETVERAISILDNKGIEIYETVYYGIKNIIIIASEKYKNTRSF